VIHAIHWTKRSFVPEKQLTHLPSKWRQETKFCFLYITFVLYTISPLASWDSNLWAICCHDKRLEYWNPRRNLSVTFFHAVIFKGFVLFHSLYCKRAKAIPWQFWSRLLGSRKVRLTVFLENRYMKVVRLSGLSTRRLYPPGDIPGTHFC